MRKTVPAWGKKYLSLGGAGFWREKELKDPVIGCKEREREREWVIKVFSFGHFPSHHYSSFHLWGGLSEGRGGHHLLPYHQHTSRTSSRCCAFLFYLKWKASKWPEPRFKCSAIGHLLLDSDENELPEGATPSKDVLFERDDVSLTLSPLCVYLKLVERLERVRREQRKIDYVWSTFKQLQGCYNSGHLPTLARKKWPRS